jgi:hypothetical protein
MCGAVGNLTDEHIIAKTVRKQLPPLTGVRRTFQGRTSGQWQALHVVLNDSVCKTCNGGWMRDLENDFVALVGPQLRNEGATRLNPDAQERLATWAIKTGLLLQLYSIAIGGQNAYAPQDNLTWLKEHVSPPPGSEVWFGRYDAQNTKVHWSRPGCLTGPEGTPVSYINAFTVGYIVFYVFGSDQQIVARRPGFNLASIKPPPWFSEIVVQTWPGNGDDAVWPHHKTLLFEQIDAFAMWPYARLPPTPPVDPGS